MPGSPVLYVSELGHERVYPVGSAIVNIGRDETNEIFLKHIEVSRRHCSVQKDGDAYFLQDYSANGVLVNGAQAGERTRLKDGDVIQVGKAVVAFLDRNVLPVLPHVRTTQKKVGELCVERGYLKEEELRDALAEQRQSKGKIGDILVGKGYVSKPQLMEVLGQQLNAPWIDLAKYHLDAETVALFSKEKALAWCALPVFHYREARKLTVAMADPGRMQDIQEMEFLTYCNIEPMLAPREDIKAAIEKYHPERRETTEDLSLRALAEAEQRAAPAPEAEPSPDAERALSKLVSAIIEEAIRVGASDIHIEPGRVEARVRYRIDGILQTVRRMPRALYPMIVNRIKILSRLDIAERRFPQDGRAGVAFQGVETDLRVSTFPTTLGEKVVLRILSKLMGRSGLDELGMSDEVRLAFSAILHRPEGLVLVVGPTGSGKTSTLYTVIHQLCSEEKSLVTLEDPVELEIEGVNQAQVYDHPRFTFASGLRAALRQDPNVLLVGEIRDEETARTAIQSALTGHMVLSTLHSNSSAGAFPRLVDMGVQPYLLTASVVGVLSQRLVRILCPKCRRRGRPAPEILAQVFGKTDTSGMSFYLPAGCEACHLGYRGRTGIFEFLPGDEEINRLIAQNAPAGEIRHKAQERGMVTLREDAIQKAVTGVTSLEEVVRVTYSGL
ncbi:MAG: Flp pilus assembly complex ATPase component TadA [Planctomycetes bacterium]|nr:Flp pilus assembly complex ATPase component TadA [Planctomycetota bacterium]